MPDRTANIRPRSVWWLAGLALAALVVIGAMYVHHREAISRVAALVQQNGERTVKLRAQVATLERQLATLAQLAAETPAAKVEAEPEPGRRAPVKKPKTRRKPAGETPKTPPDWIIDPEL